MVRVLLDDVVIAESNSPIVLEGNYYFPPDSVSKSYLVDSNTSSACPWKGTASYYSADVNGKTVKDIAWYYAQPKEKATKIKNHVAFYKPEKNKVVIEG